MEHEFGNDSMAIAFAHVSIHTRAKGHSAIAASSYRSGVKLYDARTGMTHDFSNRHDVVFSTVILPKDALAEFQNREFLWNQAELAEHRRDAQLCKDVVLALPKELDLTQQIKLTTQFVETHFVVHGLPADIAIHNHGDGNPHAHILIPTRRLEKNRFSKYKARDLNPTFANQFIVEKEYWGEQWRDCQNAFFRENGLALSVDLNHVVAERHTGRIKNKADSYLHETNQLVRDGRVEVIQDPDTFIAHIATTHSVFTRRDIERLVFKTIQNTQQASHYLHVVAEILAHRDVIKLGDNDHGIESYTTRQQYLAEGKLLEHVERLSARQNHALTPSLEAILAQYPLNEEQLEAMRQISTGSDLSVLIGRPGVGKSYLLKPIKELYQAHGCIVLGASLSGKVAKSLQTETGIPSSTIASLTYRLKTERLSLTPKHVVIIDEAGMVDFKNLAYLLKAVDEARAKIILVGDPDQLKPIHQGEIFRGIAARTGYIELGNIRRQRNEGDRKASLALARGAVSDAMKHYANQKAIQFCEGQEETAQALINAWQQNLTTESMKQHAMLAFSRSAVLLLNTQARATAIEKGLVMQNGFEYFSQNGASPLVLAKGERVLFRLNNTSLGVRNGDLATITEINAHTFKATLDSGEQVIIPQSYQSIDYGYALTVHKSQGMTVEHASIFIDNPYWDRHLAFVAMTRHKASLRIYANTNHHPDFNSLIQTLSRSTTKDNVIDWPLDFAIRSGFDPDSLAGKAIHYIAKAASTLKDKWSYLVNYEAYLHIQGVKEKIEGQAIIRTAARSVASFLDEAKHLRQQFGQLEKEALKQNLKPQQLPEFNVLYMQSLARDEKASILLASLPESIQKISKSPHVIEKIEQYSARYNRYQTIEAIAKSCTDKNIASSLDKYVSQISLSRDYPHIAYLASQQRINSKALCKKIQTLQAQHQKQAWMTLCKTSPMLSHYEKLVQQLDKAQGYRKEQLQKAIQKTVDCIRSDSLLFNQVTQKFPQIAKKFLTPVRQYYTRER